MKVIWGHRAYVNEADIFTILAIKLEEYEVMKGRTSDEVLFSEQIT